MAASASVEDNIDGGQITAREWSELIGFGPILRGLEILAWLPDVFGPARENHLVRSSSTVNASATAACRFQGNQVRLIGRVDPSGGVADVYLDGVKQLVGIDCWTPGATKHQQVLYYRNGLSAGSHEVMVVARGEKNPYARSARIFVDAVQSSAAAAEPDFGAGGGPRHTQRMIFGYSARKPCVDAAGNEWLRA